MLPALSKVCILLSECVYDMSVRSSSLSNSSSLKSDVNACLFEMNAALNEMKSALTKMKAALILNTSSLSWALLIRH